MCGIAGILSLAGKPVDPSDVRRMTNAIRHRGPDDEGFLLASLSDGRVEARRGNDTINDIRAPDISVPAAFGPASVVLGWRRLSIIDLSATGHQPMANEDGTLWVIFNGEIYNYIELRAELRTKGHTFRTQSDTEVILHAYREWGADCLHRFNGMWGMALWDTRTRELFCARDRFGVKPFYYAWDGATFAFASEIKALLELTYVDRTADDESVADYLYERVLDHSAATFFKGVKQLEPGQQLRANASGLNVSRYYTLAVNPDLGTYDRGAGEGYAQGFRDRFVDAVHLRLRSDVTLGSCLSGGLDSSSIVCVANQLLFDRGLATPATVGEKQKTFTATYGIQRYSEDAYVAHVIDRTGADARFVTPTADTLWEDLAPFIRAQDEPFISTSMYAQWNVMRLAARHGVKVLLDGQGGDEILGGYRWHIPIVLSELLRAGRPLSCFTEARRLADITGEPLSRLLAETAAKLGKPFIPGLVRRKSQTPDRYIARPFRGASNGAELRVQKSDRSLQRRLWEETTRYNLRQLLHYEDRNSMAFSIEARVPFLDYRVVEYALSIPGIYKIHDGWTKHLLRRAMHGTLPEPIQWRRDKMGFVTPELEWLKELAPRITTLLREGPWRSERFVDRTMVLDRLGRPTWNIPSQDLWRLINLELWMRTFSVA